MNHTDVYRKSLQGRGRSQCKDPKARLHLSFLRTFKNIWNMWLEQIEIEKVGGDEDSRRLGRAHVRCCRPCHDFAFTTNKMGVIVGFRRTL